MGPRFPLLDASRCEPCGLCEVACVESRYGLSGLAADDPRVLERRRLVITTVAAVPELHVCIHCPDSPCVSVCPHHALLRYPGGRVELIEPRCTGCGKCIGACPYDSIRRVTALDIAVKCDGCRGIHREPACVEACPSQALAVADDPPPAAR